MFMKKLLVAVALFSLFCIPALAQDTPQVEIYGGYGLLHDTGITLHGFQAAVEGNINKNFSIVGEFGYGQKDVTDEVNFLADLFDIGEGIEDANLKSFTFLVGPRVSYRTERVRPFAHVLFGIHRIGGSATVEGESGSEYLNNFGIAFGGGLDIVVNDTISIRPVQIDLLSSRFSIEEISIWESMVRYSGGIVIKFGSK
ncbi:MAG: outer membrane beta-barrel protein [Acidobacteria bacterium]|nr:outer membrane beta-barrel protein [Acidobacteriota bacterium]